MRKGSKNAKALQDAQIIHKRVQNAVLTKEMRRRWGLSTPKTDGDFEKIFAWWNGLSPEKSDQFEKEVEKLMGELKIPSRFYVTVFDCVLCDEAINFETRMDFPENKIEAFLKTDDLGNKMLYLQLDADAKKSDLQSNSLWSKIKHLQSLLPDHKLLTQRKVQYADHYEIIYRWKKEGMTYKQIKERAWRELRHKIRFAEDIGTILKRYKKMTGIGTRKAKN